MAHITIDSTATRISYTATASQTAFAIPFEFFDEDDLKVYQNGTLKTKTTHYTVTPITTYEGGYDGGTVTLGTGATVSDKIVIALDMAIERSTDFPTSGPFNITTLNTWIDKMFVLFKQITESTTRMVTRPNTSTETYSLNWPDGATTDPKVLQISSDAALELGPTVGTISAAATEASNAATSATAASNSATTASGHVTTASNWATKVDAAVSGSDYSAKEYAQGTQASTGGSAKSWAQDTDQVNGASTNDRSAKNWAQGSLMTGSTLGGSAKDWAQVTGGTVDGSDYSAKEYATGTTATSSKTYATKVDGAVTGTDYSSKAWAVGGTGVTDTASRGAAKEWATEAEDNTVDGSEYSAKHYSIKAAAQASAAQSSATAAASGQIYSTVVNQSAATLSPALTANGTYYLCDTSSNDVTVTLPAIGTSEGTKFAFQKTSASNSLIFQRTGSDTLNGSSSNITLTDVDSNIIFVADDNSPDNWVGTLLSQITAGSGITKTGSVLTLDLTNDQAWTGSQRSTPVTDNDGSFDMNAGNNFNWTPSGADVIEFTNETAGQGGLIYLVNGSGHAITKGSEVKCDANFLATVSAAGNYLISYYSFDGTSVVVANTLAVS